MKAKSVVSACVAAACIAAVSNASGAFAETQANARIATWDASLTETYLPYGPDQRPAWQVHIQSIAGTCTDLGTSTGLGSSCGVSGDVFFSIVTSVVGRRRVKTCQPDNNPNGQNAFATYTPSVGSPSSQGGEGFLSPAYTDDQGLPVGAPAHFHFVTHELGSDDAAVYFIAGAAVGLKACAASSATLHNGVVGFART